MDIDEVLARSDADLFWVPEDTRVIRRLEILYLACARNESYLNVVLRLQATDEQMPGNVAVPVAHDDRTATPVSAGALTIFPDERFGRLFQ